MVNYSDSDAITRKRVFQELLRECAVRKVSTADILKSFTESDVPSALEQLSNAYLNNNAPLAIRNKIGSGGYGTVFLVETEGRLHALKVFDRKASSDIDGGGQLYSPANRSVSPIGNTVLDSTNLYKEIAMQNRCLELGVSTPEVLDFGRERQTNVPAMLMQYVEGSDLEELVRSQSGVRDAKQMLLCMAGVSDDLAKMHDAGMVHRDVKPANILVEWKSMKPYMIDFGIACGFGPAESVYGSSRRDDGKIMGTILYIPPEGVYGGEVGPFSDIYSLGIVLLEAATGKSAFGEDSGVQVMRRKAESLTVSDGFLPGYPNELKGVIEKCLRREPSERYTSCRELSGDLKRLAD